MTNLTIVYPVKMEYVRDSRMSHVLGVKSMLCYSNLTSVSKKLAQTTAVYSVPDFLKQTLPFPSYVHIG